MTTMATGTVTTTGMTTRTIVASATTKTARPNRATATTRIGGVTTTTIATSTAASAIETEATGTGMTGTGMDAIGIVGIGTAIAMSAGTASVTVIAIGMTMETATDRGGRVSSPASFSGQGAGRSGGERNDPPDGHLPE
jgi:hypothetical protein